MCLVTQNPFGQADQIKHVFYTFPSWTDFDIFRAGESCPARPHRPLGCLQWWLQSCLLWQVSIKCLRHIYIKSFLQRIFVLIFRLVSFSSEFDIFKQNTKLCFAATTWPTQRRCTSTWRGEERVTISSKAPKRTVSKGSIRWIEFQILIALRKCKKVGIEVNIQMWGEHRWRTVHCENGGDSGAGHRHHVEHWPPTESSFPWLCKGVLLRSYCIADDLH